MKKVFKILNFLSLASFFIFIFSFLFIVQYFTIGLIPPLRNIVILNKFYLKEVVFIITSIYITINHFNIKSPYTDYLIKH